MNKHYTRTLLALPDDTVEAWLFEMLPSRYQVECEYVAQGKNLTLHSAYKTLLCEVLERGLLDHVKQDEVATVRYPVVLGDEPKRFLLECYPLVDLCDCQLVFKAFDCVLDADNPLPFYEIITESTTHKIPVPVKWVTKPTGEQQLSACGWVKLADDREYALQTEFEAIYLDVCQYVASLPLLGLPPFFDRLSIMVGLPTPDVLLPVGDEQISLIEAMHEDLYFSALEVFQWRLGLPQGSRDVAPGQILPNVVISKQPYLHISKEDGYSINNDDNNDIGGCPRLESVAHWLTPKQINAHLDKLSGTRFFVTSRQGRSVHGCFLGDTDAPIKLAISGGQHANESSGVVAALRAAQTLHSQTDVVLTVCPSENPDGYAAFRQLCQSNPRHMHHAARYTAAGNDLTCGDSCESLIRTVAKQHLSADVHLNLHGYPSHEWTRPLSGYVPAGFATWTIPKGFFLICRYNKGYREKAQYLLNAAIDAIAAYSPQYQQNQVMLKRYLSLIERKGFELAKGIIPFVLNESENTDYPIEIITEAPDETIYGESFRIAHESHYRVILAVVARLRQDNYEGNYQRDK